MDGSITNHNPSCNAQATQANLICQLQGQSLQCCASVECYKPKTCLRYLLMNQQQQAAGVLQAASGDEEGSQVDLPP